MRLKRELEIGKVYRVSYARKGRFVEQPIKPRLAVGKRQVRMLQAQRRMR